MRKAINLLKRHLMEVSDLESASSLLEWDECVYMPPMSSRAHTRQKATLARLAHKKFTSPCIGKLLDKLAVKAENLPYDSDDASLIRVTRREYDRAVRIPTQFVTRLEEHKSACQEAWLQARGENDFSRVASCLKAAIDLSREFAGFFPGYEHIADPLIDNHDHGLRVSALKTIFKALRCRLLPLVDAITSQPEPEDSFLYKRYPKKQQLYYGERVIERLGFDFMRGRQDLSLHPFTANMSLDDVRITTHVNERSFFDSFSSTLHEAGHAMYVQGISSSYEGTPLAKSASVGIDESQARLWENLIGRSQRFWSYFFPVLKGVFPEQLEGISLDSFYRAINKVKPSLKRTEADEVTYNLHVMIRFDLELDLLEGTLKVEDLPEAWNARYRSDLKVSPSTDNDGVLQDVHWYCDLFGGGFHSYTLGNIISAVCYERATQAHPEILTEMEDGDFTTLLFWLNDTIYKHGSKYSATELMQTLANNTLPVAPYVEYLSSKYKRLYDLGDSPLERRPAHRRSPFSKTGPSHSRP